MFLRIWMGVLCVMLGVTSVRAEKVIRGEVKDAETGDPLPQGSIQVLGTYEGTLTNGDGVYELMVKELPATLRFSYIGYQSVEKKIDLTGDERQDVLLHRVPIKLDELVVTAEDMGPNIMRKVIEEKKTWWQGLSTFQVRAYSRFTYRKETVVVGVVESLSDAYWHREHGWREVVRDKRETKNIDWKFALPAAAAVNLYNDEVEIGGHHLMGVTHPDALDHYHFKLIGRRFLDERVIYDIAVTPKNKMKSAFTGQVSVIDSVYAMAEATLTPNRSFLFPPPIRALGMTIGQQFSNTGGPYWLPIGYQSDVDMEIGMIGLRFPPIKANRVSRLSNYQINIPLPDSLFQTGRRFVTVDSASVAQDSLLSQAGVVIPLSEEETVAYRGIDSTMTFKKVYKPTGIFARFFNIDDEDGQAGHGGGYGMIWKPDVWYNRVDGAHLGIDFYAGSKRTWWALTVEGAYNVSSKQWAFGGELTRRWGKNKRGFLSIGGRRGTQVRYLSSIYNQFQTSSPQIFGSHDYFDYYWNERVEVLGGYAFRRPRVTLSGGVKVDNQASVAKTTDWHLMGDVETQRENPSIQSGNLRSVVLQAVIFGGNIGPVSFLGQRKLTLDVEMSRLGWHSDFSFTQFQMVLDWRFKTFFKRRLMANVLDIRVVGSTFLGQLPRTRYVILDVWLDQFTTFGGFRTQVDRPYEGEKHLGVFWEHNFRTVPFEIIGWQWAVQHNWSILIHGGHGRTWFQGHILADLVYTPFYLDRYHHEIGVSLNGILDLARINVTRRLDTSGTYVSFEMARLF